MSFFRALWNALLGNAPARSEPHPDRESQSATSTAVAEPPAPEAPADISRYWWLPQNIQPMQDVETVDTDRMSDSIYHTLASWVDKPSVELPRLPQITDRALSQLRDSTVNYQGLAQVLREDPTLTAAVLRVANSVAYRGFSEIRQLESAFVRIGQRGLRSVILNATVRSISISLGNAKRSLGEGIWRRSVASGVIMSELGPRYGLDADDAFLIGLLHDIGRLVTLSVVHGYESKTRARVPRAVFDRLALSWHEHAGLRLATSWNLPEPLPQLIANHHKLPDADDPLERQRLLIMTTDIMCSLMQYAPYHPYQLFEAPCAVRLGLVDDQPTRDLLLKLPKLIEERLAF